MDQINANDQGAAVTIVTRTSGFYQGFNPVVALMPKILVAALILWVGLSPSAAGQVLLDVQTWSTQNFGGWYVYVLSLIHI